jgi:hypothetical protein
MEGKMAGLLRGSAGNCRHKELQTAGLRGARPAACGALVPPCCCSKLGERREQPAPLEIMSRAVRIAARRLSVCLTAVPKSVPNPSAPHGSGAARVVRASEYWRLRGLRHGSIHLRRDLLLK